jgi:hypothetical protein
VKFSVLWGIDQTKEPKQEGLGEIKSLLPSWELFLSTVDVLEVEKEGAAPCRLPPSFDFLTKVKQFPHHSIKFSINW